MNDGLRNLLLDVWSPLSYKQPLRFPSTAGQGTGLMQHGWMDWRDRRRLTAYLILEAYSRNSARHFLGAVGEERDASEHREYGDAALIVKRALSALLGRQQEIVVDSAQNYDPDMGVDESAVEDQPEPTDPAAPPADATPAQGPTPEERAANEEARLASDRQDWLREWARDERLSAKLMDAERKCVKLGDVVYLLAWSAAKKRPMLTVMDPAEYFPVLPDHLFEQYPDRVHFAWEIPDDPDSGTGKRLRRITYELGLITGQVEPTVTSQGYWINTPLIDPEAGGQPLRPGDSIDNETGQIVRRYPWLDEDDVPSSVTCYMTDATWEQDFMSSRLDDLDESKATYARNEDGQLVHKLDLRIDFLPVVHIPNTVAGREHFGESVLSDVLQLLDDVAATDTDTQAASGTTGLPMIGLSGAQLDPEKEHTVRPGEIFNLGVDGKLSTVDTSTGMKALDERGSRLRSTLSENGRIPEAYLGRTKPTDVPSGFALALGFTPLDALVGEMRLTRDEKYGLLLKFVQRLAMAGYDPQGAPERQGSALPAGPTYDAAIEFGEYLPTNLEEIIDQVAKLRGMDPPAISLETAVSMLQRAGMPIEDVAEEIKRIESRDYDGANRLADATNDQVEVRDYLGLEGPPPTVMPSKTVMDAVRAALPGGGQPAPAGQPPTDGQQA